MSRLDVSERAAAIDQGVVLDQLPHNGPPWTYGVHGLPFFYADEGKNRSQLYRLADLPRTCPVRMRPRPDLSGYRVGRLAMRSDLAALHYPDGSLDLLPFGDLSLSLLSSMGAATDARGSLRALARLRKELALQVGLIGAMRLLFGNRTSLVVQMLKRS